MARRILVVEDEKVLSGMIRYLLESRGFEAKIAMTGEAALDFLKKERFDLVILDLMLPDMHGLQILMELRQAPVTRALPVLVVSTVKNKSVKEKAQALGIAAYLLKPFEPAELMGSVEQALA